MWRGSGSGSDRHDTSGRAESCGPARGPQACERKHCCAFITTERRQGGPCYCEAELLGASTSPSPSRTQDTACCQMHRPRRPYKPNSSSVLLVEGRERTHHFRADDYERQRTNLGRANVHRHDIILRSRRDGGRDNSPIEWCAIRPKGFSAI